MCPQMLGRINSLVCLLSVCQSHVWYADHRKRDWYLWNLTQPFDYDELYPAENLASRRRITRARPKQRRNGEHEQTGRKKEEPRYWQAGKLGMSFCKGVQ